MVKIMNRAVHGHPCVARRLRRVLATFLFTAGSIATAAAQMTSMQEQWLALAQSGGTPAPTSPAPAADNATPPGYLFSLVNPEAQAIGQFFANKGNSEKVLYDTSLV